MEESKISIEKTALKAGLIICASLIIYFMLMRFLNLTNSAIAWSFNFIILFTGITLTYRYYRTKTKLNIEYLPGMMLGCITTGVAAISFTFFVYTYFSSLDPSLLQLLKDNILFMGQQITPLRVAGATIIEGICSGVIISFMMMQYYKSGFKRTMNDTIVQG